MYSNIHKTMSVFLVVAIILTMSLSPISAVFAETGMDLVEEIKIHENNKARQAGEMLAAALDEDAALQNKNYGYPDYFAGSYISDGTLYVCFSDASEECIAMYVELLRDYKSKVAFEYRSCSFEEKTQYANDVASSLKGFGCELCNWGAYSQSDAINITTTEETYELALSKLSLVSTNPNIEIILEASVPYEFETTKLTGGTKIRTSAFSFTLAATGTYNGSNAFLSSGHSLSTNDTVYYKSTSSAIGTVSKIVLGNGDFSIGTLNSSYTISHSAYTSSSSTILWNGTTTGLSVGDTVRRYGQASGYSYQKITALGQSLTVSGITLSGVATAEITSGSHAAGDSGGPVWTEGLKFCGVHSCARNSNEVCFTPYNLISSSGFSICAKHNGTWQDYNSTYHKKYCSICEKTIYEAHSAYYNSSTNKCTRCGRPGTITTESITIYPISAISGHDHCGHD